MSESRLQYLLSTFAFESGFDANLPSSSVAAACYIRAGRTPIVLLAAAARKSPPAAAATFATLTIHDRHGGLDNFKTKMHHLRAHVAAF
jgi:hypothetical protein